jgi:hypothetical protein
MHLARWREAERKSATLSGSVLAPWIHVSPIYKSVAANTRCVTLACLQSCWRLTENYLPLLSPPGGWL